jgi:GTPase SAR1 family protein
MGKNKANVENENKAKIAVGGAEGVGKSSLCIRVRTQNN